MGQGKNQQTKNLKLLGDIITESGLVINYPRAFPLIDIKKIKRNPQNIKIHTKEQVHDIAELIKMVGFKDPVVLDETEIMFAGHGRLDAAELLGMPKVPWYPLNNLTDAQKKVFLIMDNKVNDSAWVSENLKIIFDELDPIEFENFQLNFDTYFQSNMEMSKIEWSGMPEFDQESQEAYRTVFIKFDNENDIKEFAKVIKQNITKLTKAIWFPYKPVIKTTKEYVDKK